MFTRREVLLSGLSAGSMIMLGGVRAHALTLPSQPPPPIRFDVLRAGSVIGRHEVDFSTIGGGLGVRTRIDIEVLILGVKAFEFRHTGTEVWEDHRLRSFHSETLDDDSEFFVDGRATIDGFQVTHKKGSESAPADIMVGSYWTPEIARQTLLIDPKRGRLKQQRLLGTDRVTLSIGGASVEATRYRVAGVSAGSVDYDDQGHWLAAQLTEKGSDILYVRRA